MTDTYTLNTLSKMTMVEIMNQMNHYRELSISNHRDKIELIKKNDEQFNKHMDEKKELNAKYSIEIKELKNKLTKPKRKQIKATKSDLQGWLDQTERQLMSVIDTNYSNADPYEINTMFDICDGRFNNKLRPEFRGLGTKYQTKLDIDDDELY